MGNTKKKEEGLGLFHHKIGGRREKSRRREPWGERAEIQHIIGGERE